MLQQSARFAFRCPKDIVSTMKGTQSLGHVIYPIRAG